MEPTIPRQTSLSNIAVPKSSVLMLVSLEITSGNDSFLPLALSELDFQRRREEMVSDLARKQWPANYTLLGLTSAETWRRLP